MPHMWVAALATAVGITVQVYAPDTAVGTSIVVVLPMPSWPLEFTPTQYRLPPV